MRLVSGISRAIAPAYVRTIGSGCVLQVYLHDALRRSHLPLDVARCGAAACPADLFGPWTAADPARGPLCAALSCTTAGAAAMPTIASPGRMWLHSVPSIASPGPDVAQALRGRPASRAVPAMRAAAGAGRPCSGRDRVAVMSDVCCKRTRVCMARRARITRRVRARHRCSIDPYVDLSLCRCAQEWTLTCWRRSPTRLRRFRRS